MAIKYDSKTDHVSHHVCDFKSDINNYAHSFEDIETYESKVEEGPKKG